MHSVIPVSLVNQTSRRQTNNERERNLIAPILFSIIIIILMIVAMNFPNWYYLKGGGCSKQVLGMDLFFDMYKYKTVTISTPNGNITYASLENNDDMKFCVTSEIIVIQKVIIGLCFLIICFNFCQIYSDVNGVTNQSSIFIKICGLGSIFSVITVIVIIGLSYYSSQLMEHLQEMTKLYPATRVEVGFGIGYYIIAASGIVGVLATASNLFRCEHLSGNIDVGMLLDDQNEEETFSNALPHSRSWSQIREQNSYLNDLPPPPPYTP